MFINYSDELCCLGYLYGGRGIDTILLWYWTKVKKMGGGGVVG